MQSPAWYVNRLKSMSLSEIVWRLMSLLTSHIEQLRIITGLIPRQSDIASIKIEKMTRGFSLPDINRDKFKNNDYLLQASANTLQHADEILAHRFTYFNHQQVDLGKSIDWHYDYNSHISSPIRLSAHIDYRNVKTSGDCKEIWEPNRHHQLVVLARAYAITLDEKYAFEICNQIDQWLLENPYGTGMNWRSPLELGIRLINWVFALELIKASEAIKHTDLNKILHAIYLHYWDVGRKFSKGSSANNHLVGEVAGVFVAASWLPEMKKSITMRDECKKILCEEIQRQTYSDGCTKEQALGYEFFVIQFYVICGLVGRWTNNEFPAEYWDRIKTMLGFVADLAQAGTRFPMFGDRDDGYVLDLGNEPDDINMLLNLGAILFDSAEFKSQSKEFTETAYWLFGEEGYQHYGSIQTSDTKSELTSKAYQGAGYYLLQTGQMDSPDNISLLFDCAELGYGSIAAHGHADALSFMLRVGGIDVLVDPGTYDYFTYPEWRKYFRSTAAHNTVEIDGQNQSELLGAFLWGKRANSTCLDWQQNGVETKIVAQHDGYSRLPDPAIHRRTLVLNGETSRISISDNILAKDRHEIKLHFHLSEYCVIEEISDSNCIVSVADKTVRFQFDTQCRTSVVNGQESPICGWLSRNYHQKVPINTLVVIAETSGNATIETNIQII